MKIKDRPGGWVPASEAGTILRWKLLGGYFKANKRKNWLGACLGGWHGGWHHTNASFEDYPLKRHADGPSTTENDFFKLRRSV